MASKVNKKGRSQHGHRYVGFDYTMLKSIAFRSLSCGARALLIEFNLLYNGSNNGELFFSQRDMAKALDLTSHATAARYANELIDRKFIRVKIKGAFSVKTKRATSYVLEQWPYRSPVATRAFMAWRPPEPEKSRKRKSSFVGPSIDPKILTEWPVSGV